MSLSNHSFASLAAIGWPLTESLPEIPVGSQLARVIAQHRNRYQLHTGYEEISAQPARHFLKRSRDASTRPAVGDFVVFSTNNLACIETVLPRRSVISRIAAGNRHIRQIIATNIDYVLITMGLDGDFNLRRLERYLLLTHGARIKPIILLSKRDLFTEKQIEDGVAEVSAMLPPDAPVYPINNKDYGSLIPLLDYLTPGKTAVLVGSSGVGKSTLTNTLSGVERQETSKVRESDSRGRHTTSTRALIQLPSGGCLIDTPGMREIKFTGEEALSESSFVDIEVLAKHCRFTDCVHETEPGCAVISALATGALDAARWKSYQKLQKELAAASENLEMQLKRKGEIKLKHQSLNSRLVEKYGKK